MRDATSKRRIAVQVALAVLAVLIILGALIISPTTSIAGSTKPTYELTLTPVNPATYYYHYHHRFLLRI